MKHFSDQETSGERKPTAEGPSLQPYEEVSVMMIDSVRSVGVSAVHIPEQVSSSENQTVMPGTAIPADLCDLPPSSSQTKV